PFQPPDKNTVAALFEAVAVHRRDVGALAAVRRGTEEDRIPAANRIRPDMDGVHTAVDVGVEVGCPTCDEPTVRVVDHRLRTHAPAAFRVQDDADVLPGDGASAGP